MKLITTPIPIFHGTLRVVISEDFGTDYKTLGGPPDPDKDPNNYGALVWSDQHKSGVFRYNAMFKANPAPDLIAHEVVHLVNAVFIRIGATLDPHNDEPQAYLTGWFVKQVYKALKRP